MSQKFWIYCLALAAGIGLSVGFETGEPKDYMYGILPGVIGLFYVFLTPKK